LKAFEHEGSLRFPLLGGGLESRGRSIDLLGVGFASLLAQLARLILGVFEILGKVPKIGRDGCHISGILSLVELSKGDLDIFLDSVGKLVMRKRDAFDRLVDASPRALEDTIGVKSDGWP
jgi:hypothetical protein